ncbi:MAG: hypothetical protein B6U76_00790 [Desulfurococcales archaeon ex4484_217_2]|nr:MAG: hypothetical protein B6U76_00790 [Desulfurococcales archaeon ex4484_217_2]
MGRRVPTAHKYYSMFKFLCENGPASLSEITDHLISEYGMRYSTARPAVTRLYRMLSEYGLVSDVGTDKRGSRVIDLTPKALSILIMMIASYGASYLSFHPKIIRPAVKRLCPRLLEKFDDFAKVVEEADKYGEKEKGDPYRRFVSEFFGYAAPLEEEFSGKKEYTCEDVNQAIDAGVEAIISTLDDLEKDFEKAMASILMLDLKKEFKEVLLQKISNLLREKKREVRKLRRKIRVLEKLIEDFKV